MARRQLTRQQERLVGLGQPHVDWHMAPETMSRYLAYRLYILEHQINGVVDSLGRHVVTPYPSALDDRLLPEEAWSSWAQLSYLLQARDRLKAAMARPSHRKGQNPSPEAHYDQGGVVS